MGDSHVTLFILSYRDQYEQEKGDQDHAIPA